MRPHYGITPSGGVNFRKAFRHQLWQKHGCACHYCGALLESLSCMTIDHVNPQHEGGGHEVENLVAACALCNARKGHQSLEDFRWFMAVSRSRVSGIITPKQARAVIDCGFDLGVEPYVFHFERA